MAYACRTQFAGVGGRSLWQKVTRTICTTHSGYTSQVYKPNAALFKENAEYFKTVKERPTPVEGIVKGCVPAWVSGRLLRNGPGMFEFGDTKYNHWFDGQALLHSFTIVNGGVTYQSRYLRSDTYRRNMAANRIVVSEFGTAAYPDPCKTIFQRMLSVFNVTDFTDNDFVNIYPIGRDFVAASESDVIHSFDPETLETKDRIQLSKYVAVNMATAHAHYEPDGATYNLGSSFKSGACYNIIKFHPNSTNGGQLKAEVVCSIPAKKKAKPSYYHSFGMTSDYFVFLEQPIYLNLMRIFVNTLRRQPPVKNLFEYGSEEKVRLYVVAKNTGKVLKTKYMSADTFYCFHHVNAYEDRGHLVVDLCCHGYPDIYGLFDIETMRSDNYPRIMQDVMSKLSVRRYVLPLELDKKPEGENLVTLEDTSASAVLQKDGTVVCTHEILSPIAFEFPQINYRLFNGKKYGTVYGVSSSNEDALVKLDTRTKQTNLWREDDCSLSEPVFVARPGATEEDDGVILSSVLRNAVGRSPFLLVLDGRTFKEIARVEFEGVDIHKDLHGLFAPFSGPRTD